MKIGGTNQTLSYSNPSFRLIFVVSMLFRVEIWILREILILEHENSEKEQKRLQRIKNLNA